MTCAPKHIRRLHKGNGPEKAVRRQRRKDSKKEESKKNSNFPKFSYFRKLPAELRLRIWYGALKLRDNLTFEYLGLDRKSKVANISILGMPVSSPA
jgi:hypothetical protein